MSAAEPDPGPDEPDATGGEASRRAVPPFAAHAAETDLLAGIGQRIGARLLDLVIVGLPLSILIFAVSDISEDRRTISTPLWVQILGAAVSALYEIVLIRMRGQTVGKRLLAVKVVRITDGAPPDWTASVVRYLLPIVPVMIPVPFVFLLAFVIYLAAIPHPLRRGWHDRAAGTIVIRSEPAVRPKAPPPPPSANGSR